MFKLVKEIRSKSGELHFCRWRILESPWLNIYIHLIAKSDEDKHPHNHPWSFWSITLLGKYNELISTKFGKSWFGPKSIVSFKNKNIYHKVYLIEPTLSLVITGPRNKDKWGYLLDNYVHVDFDEYRNMKNGNSF